MSLRRGRGRAACPCMCLGDSHEKWVLGASSIAIRRQPQKQEFCISKGGRGQVGGGRQLEEVVFSRDLLSHGSLEGRVRT